MSKASTLSKGSSSKDSMGLNSKEKISFNTANQSNVFRSNTASKGGLNSANMSMFKISVPKYKAVGEFQFQQGKRKYLVPLYDSVGEGQ